jgi:uroporphyrinogen decarboxylase
MVHFQDDWGSQKDLFFNPQIWRSLIKPHVARVINAAHELNILFDMHSCGKIDRIVDEIVEMGVDVLDPVQPINDLQRWNDDYHGKVIFMGALDAQNVIDNPDSTEDDIKREVQEKTDLFAKNGYFIPFAVALSPRVMDALDESYIYGRALYNDKYADDIAAFIGQHEKSKNEYNEPTLVPGMELKAN